MSTLPAPSNILYVGNIPKGTQKGNLEQFLQNYGVMRINVREGYGIAEMNSIAEAQRAIQQLDGINFNGQSLAVRFKTQPHHKQQYRQVNSNNSSHSNHNMHHQHSNAGKDALNGKSYIPISPTNMMQPSSEQQLQPQQSQFFQDLSSPQMTPVEVRTVQMGLRGLQVTTTNSFNNQRKIDHNNIASMPEGAKIRELEATIDQQRSIIKNLEQRVEELENMNKQLHLQHQIQVNRPNILVPQISLHPQAAAPQLAQPPAHIAVNHQQHPFPGHPSHHPQFNPHQPQPGQFFGTAQQLPQWTQATFATNPTAQFYSSDQNGQQQNGFNNPPATLMLHPQAKFEPAAFIAAPGYTQNVQMTPVDGMNFFATGTQSGTQMPMSDQNVFHHHHHPQLPQQQQQHSNQQGPQLIHQHPVPPAPRNEFQGHGKHETSNNNMMSGQGHRFNNNINQMPSKSGFNNQHKHGNGNGNQSNSNRPLRGGNNRQNGYQHRVNHGVGGKSVNEIKKPAAASVNQNENKAPSADLSPVEGVKQVECPRCLKSIPENCSKCPDCRIVGNNSVEDECNSSDKGASPTPALAESPEHVSSLVLTEAK